MTNRAEDPTLPNIDPRVGVAEVYSNTLYEGHECKRYWVPGFPIMIGGSILSAEDWEHLRRDFGVTDVVNVETEHDDSGKVPEENLLQARVHDDMSPFPPDKVLAACIFGISRLFPPNRPDPRVLYVHCQMGGSRSPAFAYAILRAVYKLPPADALDVIRACPGREGYGAPGHTHHVPYLNSVEAALEQLERGA